MGRLEHQLAARTHNSLDEQIFHALTGPVVVLIFAQGIFLAALTLDILASQQTKIYALWGATLVGMLAISAGHVFSAVLVWYSRRDGPQTRVELDNSLVNRLRKLTVGSLYILAGVIILGQMGIEVSPLVAGLGISGLALSLALQPTLSNLFAGTYLVSDKVAKPGDFVEMEGGVQGYVVDVGWRSTRIRTLYNNLVVVPNSRVADSIVTNYFLPTKEIGVLVNAGVSYASDLAHVRRTSLAVAKEVIAEMAEASKSFDPWFGYEEFGESNIKFWVWLEAKDRISSFALKSTLIERLHQRFREEGIEINYPVRKLVFSPDGNAAPVSPPPTTSVAKSNGGG